MQNFAVTSIVEATSLYAVDESEPQAHGDVPQGSTYAQGGTTCLEHQEIVDALSTLTPLQAATSPEGKMLFLWNARTGSAVVGIDFLATTASRHSVRAVSGDELVTADERLAVGMKNSLRAAAEDCRSGSSEGAHVSASRLILPATSETQPIAEAHARLVDQRGDLDDGDEASMHTAPQAHVDSTERRVLPRVSLVSLSSSSESDDDETDSDTEESAAGVWPLNLLARYVGSFAAPAS